MQNPNENFNLKVFEENCQQEEAVEDNLEFGNINYNLDKREYEVENSHNSIDKRYIFTFVVTIIFSIASMVSIFKGSFSALNIFYIVLVVIIIAYLGKRNFQKERNNEISHEKIFPYRNIKQQNIAMKVISFVVYLLACFVLVIEFFRMVGLEAVSVYIYKAAGSLLAPLENSLNETLPRIIFIGFFSYIITYMYILDRVKKKGGDTKDIKFFSLEVLIKALFFIFLFFVLQWTIIILGLSLGRGPFM